MSPAEPQLLVTSTTQSLAVQPRNPSNGSIILQCPPEPGICFEVGDAGVGRFGNNDLSLEEWERGTARAVGGFLKWFCESSHAWG